MKKFVSHSYKDNALIVPFVEDLRNAGIEVWVDLESITHDDFIRKMNEGLEQSEWLVLVQTPNSLPVRSSAVEMEINAALGKKLRRTLRDVIPFLMAPCDPNEVPPIWANLHHYDAVRDGYATALAGLLRALGVSTGPRTISPVLTAQLPGATAAPPAPRSPPAPSVIVRQSPPVVAPKPSPAPVSPTPALAPSTTGPTITRRALLATGLTVGTVAALGGGFYWFSHLKIPRGSTGTSPTATARSTATTPQAFVPASLAKLGFVGKVINGIQVIIPPVVSVPAGPFLMGSDPAKDPNAQPDEQPQSTITIAQAYQIGQYHVTVAEYALAVQAGAVGQPQVNGPSWQTQLSQLDHPVVNVSWFDVVKYVQWLAQVTSDAWRLPTEAEWEKADRGTDGRIYPWGNQWDQNKANTFEGGLVGTTPVGAYSRAGDASPYGAHDMAGNVRQWCSTIYNETSFPYPYKSGDGRENMSDPSSLRVLRGGSWNYSSLLARAANRISSSPDHVNGNIGVRVLRVSTSSS